MRQENKKMMVVAMVIGIVLIGGVALLLIPTTTTQTQQQISPTPTGIESTSQTPTGTNPYIDQKELERFQSDYNKNVQAAGGTLSAIPAYHFDYQIAPNVDKTNAATPAAILPDFLQKVFSKKVFAASACDINEAPKTLPAYQLKVHTVSSDAQKVAAKFSVTGAVNTLEDNATVATPFTYIITQSDGSFVTVAEASESIVAQYHQPAISPGTDIGLAQAKTKADEVLKSYPLSADVIPLTANYDRANDQYIFTYRLQWGTLPLVDRNVLATLTGTVCGYNGAGEMNNITVVLQHDGAVSRIIDHTRKAVTKIDIPLISLTQAVGQYKDNMPVAPVITDPNTPTTGTVTITAAQLCYFDYGSEKLAQAAYVPSYCTTGTINGITIKSVFPAVASTDLQKTQLYKAIHTSQLHTLKPIPQPLRRGQTCADHLMSITGTCSASGITVCTVNATGSLPVQTPQPSQACMYTKQIYTHVLQTVNPGSNACKDAIIMDPFNLVNSPEKQITVLNPTIPATASIFCQMTGLPY